jgi:hypothetical protein
MIYQNRNLLSEDEAAYLDSLECSIWQEIGNWKWAIRAEPYPTLEIIQEEFQQELKSRLIEAGKISNQTSFCYGSDPGSWIGEAMRELINSLLNCSINMRDFFEWFSLETGWSVRVQKSVCPCCEKPIAGEIIVIKGIDSMSSLKLK